MGYTSRQVQQGKDDAEGRNLIPKSINCLQTETERGKSRRQQRPEAIQILFELSRVRVCVRVCVCVALLCVCV